MHDWRTGYMGRVILAVAVLGVWGCEREHTPWPASLRVIGDGYPQPGQACRRLGETAATVDYLDDTRILVGCPTQQDAAALGGRALGQVDGVFLLDLPAAR